MKDGAKTKKTAGGTRRSQSDDDAAKLRQAEDSPGRMLMAEAHKAAGAGRVPIRVRCHGNDARRSTLMGARSGGGGGREHGVNQTMPSVPASNDLLTRGWEKGMAGGKNRSIGGVYAGMVVDND